MGYGNPPGIYWDGSNTQSGKGDGKDELLLSWATAAGRFRK
jgi:hypothetical protein